MTPIEKIPDTYEPEEFDQFPDSLVAITGLDWITKGDDQEGIFTVQTGRGTQRMVARYRTIQADGKEGPPGSIERGQLPFLVRAFGGDASELPPYNDSVARLEVARRIVNASGKQVVVKSAGGWIKQFPGTQLPPGAYQVTYRDCPMRNRLGERSWVEGDYGPFVLIEMEVLGDSVGNPIPWVRCKVREFLSYALEVEDGQLKWSQTEKGSWTYNAVTQHNFMTAICGPDILDVKFGDLANVMPEVHREATKAARVLHGVVERSTRGQKRCRLKLGMLFPVPEKQETPATKTTPADPLMDVLNSEFKGSAFAKDGKLVDDAKVWLREFMGTDPSDGKEVQGIAAFCDKHGIPKAFKRMDSDSVAKILAWMGKEVTVSDGEDDEFD